jgi:hypothetical protein
MIGNVMIYVFRNCFSIPWLLSENTMVIAMGVDVMAATIAAIAAK